ncbi:MAG: hypothetical protein K5764_10455 [Prevotella sp.]|nr:hypothetical protein [Prevotella sp.]
MKEVGRKYINDARKTGRMGCMLILQLFAMLVVPKLSHAQDTLVWRDFDFTRQGDVWLTAHNAAGLTRYHERSLSAARLYLDYQEGGLTNFYEAPRALQAGASVESFYRLSPRTVLYGQIAYDNFSGRDMGGSAFIQRRLPFDIVEDSLTNLGTKHRDTYRLTGAIGIDIGGGVSLGAHAGYTAANYAKYKDLRHKNKLMDLSIEPALTYSPTSALTIGASYRYRRVTESLTFSTYGSEEKVYKSLINYANFIGQVEQFGSQGYTDKNREMPLVDDYHGAAVQCSWQSAGWEEGQSGPGLQLFGELTYTHRSGYYGRKSPYTITYSEHDADSYGCHAQIAWQTADSRHQIDGALGVENLENRRNTFRQLSNERGATYYEYYDAVKAADHVWTDGHLTYTCWTGTNHESGRWTLPYVWRLQATANWQRRRQTAYVYPYLRRQQLSSLEGRLEGQRILAMHKGLLTVTLGISYKKGSGAPYEDATLATPSDKQSAPADMAALLWREYQYITAPQYAIDGSLSYSFVLPATHLQTYVQAAAAYRKATETYTYSDGSHRLQLQLTLGCLF